MADRYPIEIGSLHLDAIIFTILQINFTEKMLSGERRPSVKIKMEKGKERDNIVNDKIEK